MSAAPVSDCNSDSTIYQNRRKYIYRYTQLDYLKQYLYSDAEKFDQHNLPILHIDNEMELRLKNFEKVFQVRIPDELYEIFASTEIQRRVRDYLSYDLMVPPPMSNDEQNEQIKQEVLFEQNWVILPQPPEDMDYAFMITCDAARHCCTIIGWKSDWTQTGMMYGCKYLDYKRYISKVLLPNKSHEREPIADKDGFMPASKFNRRSRKEKRPITLSVNRLLGADGKKLTFTNFLLHAIPDQLKLGL